MCLGAGRPAYPVVFCLGAGKPAHPVACCLGSGKPAHPTACCAELQDFQRGQGCAVNIDQVLGVIEDVPEVNTCQKLCQVNKTARLKKC